MHDYFRDHGWQLAPWGLCLLALALGALISIAAAGWRTPAPPEPAQATVAWGDPWGDTDESFDGIDPHDCQRRIEDLLGLEVHDNGRLVAMSFTYFTERGPVLVTFEGEQVKWACVGCP